MLIQNLLICSAADASLFKVVIDPGHGGSDEGAVVHTGRVRIAEKDITLKLARLVAYQLRTKGFMVALTRDRDAEMPLPSRTALANRMGADVFISIHMNSTLNDAQGVETFILNNATDASSKRLAHLENSVLSPDPDTQAKAKPLDLDVALILKDLRLDGNLSESKRLACNIQTNLVSTTSNITSHGRRRNRGVKQALFHVLLGADMPSVLVETGFLSNSEDRAFILSHKGQYLVSRAIAEAIENYRNLSREQLRHPKLSAQKLLKLSRCKVN